MAVRAHLGSFHIFAEFFLADLRAVFEMQRDLRVDEGFPGGDVLHVIFLEFDGVKPRQGEYIKIDQLRLS